MENSKTNHPKNAYNYLDAESRKVHLKKDAS
jgi:hypothetical protein